VNPDLLLSLRRHGYHALARDRARRAGGDVYVSRLLGRRAVVLRGPAAAESFYDESLARRRDGAPRALTGLLFGNGAVHGLDDEAHRLRKELFLHVLGDDRIEPLVEDIGTRLTSVAGGWRGTEIALFDELVQVYGAAVQSWAGCRVEPASTIWLSRQLAAIVDGFGGAGRAYLRGWVARRRCDHWASGAVEEVRSGRYRPPDGSPLSIIAGTDLPARTAGVELLNLLRPTTAIAWPATFLALALCRRPELREALRGDRRGPEHRSLAQEVRRTTPFVPALAARARRPGTIGSVAVRAGDRLVLDVYGTDVDCDTWPDPGRIDPARFREGDPGPFDMVPQGGGDPHGHRCPGEPLTIDVLAETARVLADLDLAPAGPTTVDLSRMPALPPEGLRLRVL
jgi:fatty-acid peroxygenase